MKPIARWLIAHLYVAVWLTFFLVLYLVTR